MIEFRAVSKSFSGGAVAVEEFSYVLPSHRTVALVGSSGSGKTTLLRMVNRMLEPGSGTVLIDGRDVREFNKVALRRSIGYVMQDGGLLPHRTVAENISTVPVLNRVSRKEARVTALELLEQVGLDLTLADRYPAQLSGGQRQRVGVARALAADPNILLMDEPFGAVDPIVRRELQNQLLALQSRLGKTMVFVTHDIDEALLLGDEVIVLRSGGRIAQVGPPAEILAAPADAFVRDFIGADRPERVLRIVETQGRKVVLDQAGRPAGVLAS
ncbi:ABC transporter ATP-binding protein [Paeniglutamicibacter terrestris]|uniref:ATP-binding cassette domain-containing protein n=1 Tax=Paeniglutamicibacter terrestris TaxID=2723403 RepID=A0ABX1G0T5_9MICC|nr:ATP-binding cassette domain-containing protein [Paeniglutamicibacter terrestris]NKG19828.1 ATP-binding cassette domain-containing protein [Paeniglutamicibacter terrestris]